MLTRIKKQDLEKALSFYSSKKGMDVNTPVSRTFLEKIEGNEDYRDVIDEDIKLKSVEKAISIVFNEMNVIYMILKNDNTNRIAFVFDSIPGEPEGFEKVFNSALENGMIDFHVGWMEDWDNLVFIIQF